MNARLGKNELRKIDKVWGLKAVGPRTMKPLRPIGNNTRRFGNTSVTSISNTRLSRMALQSGYRKEYDVY